MIRAPDSSPPGPLTPRPLPAGPGPASRQPEREGDAVDAAFLAGANLSFLDSIVRSDAPWMGAWRQRLALTAAAASARMAGRREDEAALRDAWCLRRPGTDPGPAGRILGAWRQLARSRGVFELVGDATTAFGLPAGDDLSDIAEMAQELGGRPPLVAAAEIATLTCRRRPEEILALVLADLVLARRLNWPLAVPLLVAEIASLKNGHGRRPRPGDADWLRSLSLAYARAAARACELARRADTLQKAAPKLRAKGAGPVIAALMSDDALTAASGIGGMSDRGLRRLFDRLVAFGALRELSGRETFRLYGL